VAILNPDLSEAQDMGPIPEGTYKGKIVEVNTQNAKNEAKTPMAVPKVELTVDGKKRTRKTYLMTSGEGASGFDNLLRACHFDALADQYKDPNLQPKPPFDTDTLIGQEVQVIVVPEYFQRKDGSGNPIGEPELRDRIKGFLKA
jgi:hypothetical protein